jgi:Uma2 family endonuclease
VEKKKYPDLEKGMFHGLHKAVQERTGISLPVIHQALTEQDDRSKKKLQAIRVALEIIRERGLLAEDEYCEPNLNNPAVSEPVAEYAMLDLQKAYTYWDYLKWTFLDRVELIRGKVVKMSPAPSSIHQLVVRVVNRYFDQFFIDKPCGLFYSPFDVRLPVPGARKDSTVVQPDLTVICDVSKIDERGCFGVPDIMVEILSPGNSRHDMNVKFNLYEASGVQEYWIIQPQERSILIYLLENGRYIGLPPFTEGTVACGRLFSGLILPVDEVFGYLPKEHI